MPRTVPNRLVVKFGTGILTRPDGSTLDIPQIRRLTQELGAAVKTGRHCLLVSSGAVGAGMMALGYQERPRDLPSVQACAAVGQSRLMRLYQTLFTRHGLHIAQMLLTHQDLDSLTRRANARNTLERLMQRGDVLPIINENDSVAVEELRFSDNDHLSSDVAILAEADHLVICTSANGLTRSGNPDDPPIPEVSDVREVLGLAQGGAGRFSVGGMATKLAAVQTAVEAGVTASIINGRTPGALAEALNGGQVGTTFHPLSQRSTLASSLTAS